MNDLVGAVKDYANKHYNDGGWDVVVECWSNEQIAKCIADSTTKEEAIAAVQNIVDVYAERQAAAKNSAF